MRERNEDALLVDEALGLFAVADGIGGHQAGAVASRIVVETLRRSVGAAPADTEPDEVLPDALESAHRAVREAADAEPGRHGMGAAVVALWIPPQGDAVRVAHVGDCRCYLFRDGRIERLTQDHTLYGELARAGLLPPEPADRPSPHTLTQSIGAVDVFAPDVRSVRVRPGDLCLLCSDGLTDVLKDEDLERLLSCRREPRGACEELVAEANRRGGRDDVTVLAVSLDEDPDAGRTAAPGSPMRQEG